MPELTKAAIEKLTVPEGKFDAYIWDAALPSFGIRKVHTGALSFVVKFTIGGRQRKQSLGKLIITGSTTKDDVARAIRAARAEAQTALARARLNDDFKAEAREKLAEAASQAKTEAAERARLADKLGPRIETYLKERRKDMRPGSLREVTRHLGKHLQPLHDLPVSDLRRDIIAAEISRIAGASGAVTADRVRASFSAFCGWLIERQIVEHNPCIGIKRKANGGGRERVLAMDELVAIWRTTGSDSDHDKIIRLLLLTGQRREEIGGLRWDEVNFDKRQIELPEGRTKNGRAHIIPLSDQALAILKSVPVRHARKYLFGHGSGPFSGFSKCKERLDARLGKQVAPWVVHDLRRSFVSHCADLDFGSVLAIEAAINHLSGERGGIKGIYNRGKQERQKRELMDRWGQHIAELVAEGDVAVEPAGEPEPQPDPTPGPTAAERRQAFRYFKTMGRKSRSNLAGASHRRNA